MWAQKVQGGRNLNVPERSEQGALQRLREQASQEETKTDWKERYEQLKAENLRLRKELRARV